MKKVLLTGISGFVGQHCAVQLLENGYAVRGSIRNLSKEQEVRKGIAKVIDAKDNLEFCELDLSSDRGWDKAMEGCEYVLHVASPFVIAEPKDENEMIKPAVEGTLRALNAAKKAGIKKVVLTSSAVAMAGDKKKNHLTQESWTNSKTDKVSAYMKSKTLAERAAWDFYKNQDSSFKMELTVINPGPIYGPTLSGNLNGESMGMYKQLISGKMPLLPRFAINLSDVRDVAAIHVAALKNEKANGKRFIVSTEKAHKGVEMAEILKENGYSKVSTKLAPNFMLRFMARFDNDLKGMLPFIGNTFNGDVSETMKTFNWKPMPLEKTVLDTAKSVEEAMKK